MPVFSHCDILSHRIHCSHNWTSIPRRSLRMRKIYANAAWPITAAPRQTQRSSSTRLWMLRGNTTRCIPWSSRVYHIYGRFSRKKAMCTFALERYISQFSNVTYRELKAHVIYVVTKFMEQAASIDDLYALPVQCFFWLNAYTDAFILVATTAGDNSSNDSQILCDILLVKILRQAWHLKIASLSYEMKWRHSVLKSMNLRRR